MGGPLVFCLQSTELKLCGMGNGENGSAAVNSHITEHKKRHAILEEWGAAVFYHLKPLAEPVKTFKKTDRPPIKADTPLWESDWSSLLSVKWTGITFTLWQRYTVKSDPKKWIDVFAYMTGIQDELSIGLKDGERRGHWYTRLDDRGTSSEMPCSPPQWLFPPAQPGELAKSLRPFEPRVPFYIDWHDYGQRTIEYMKKEREVQRSQIAGIFNTSRVHRAFFIRSDGPFYYMGIREGVNREDDNAVPDIAPGTEVKFLRNINTHTEYDEADLILRGEVVEMTAPYDLAVFVRGSHPSTFPGEFLVVTSIKANLYSIDKQINALRGISTCQSFGDRAGNEQQGFSLQKTMLAHGTELSPDNEGYFFMDARTMGNSCLQLSREEIDHRIQYISAALRLDEPQMKAFRASVLEMKCGLSLIQGPPGTGKSTTSSRIALAWASLGFKVLVAAGSNFGVDQLSEKIVELMSSDPRIEQWAGNFCRVRTPARQIAEIRCLSKDNHARPRRDALRSHALEKYEMRTHVLKYMDSNPDQPASRDLKELIALDKHQGLSRDETKKLKKTYAQLCKLVFVNSRIVATTLNNSACDLLLKGYSPDILLCDEAGQCTEGDLAIALSLDSLRGFILVGDPCQLSPTILSSNQNNEGWVYLARSTLDRLTKAGYPHTLLESHWRCHPEIMNFPNREFYEGKLVNKRENIVTRVGYVYHCFTKTFHHFWGNNLENARRLCVSVDEEAEQAVDSTSWSNEPQANVVIEMIEALLRFQAPNGMRIEPSDIMVISPYKDQRVLPGNEANIVFFMTVKPSNMAQSIGFFGDKSRLNVALTRAKELLVIVTNLRKWSPHAIQDMKKRDTSRSLGKLLEDVSARGHTLNWFGKATVARQHPPPNFRYAHHDWDVRNRRVFMSRAPIPPLPRSVPAATEDVDSRPGKRAKYAAS
ncbi:P-loop containing nucleoside triphosphate hydrolase protein [Aspergillus karnatakaensis]|uniref:DEAD/DEAH box helicase n=1 Tax=Aspergillus karnatakaensis TaxID=1810916 RepID=UPI003CCCA368